MKPVRIQPKNIHMEAMRWQPDDAHEAETLLEWMAAHGGDPETHVWPNGSVVILLDDLAEPAEPGHWVILGVTGRFFAVKPEDYANNYEEVAR